ncbi:MAG: hypothetical protein WC495_02090 [Patescibacteria group bacterium]
MEDPQKLSSIKQLIQSAEASLNSAKQMLDELTGDAPVSEDSQPSLHEAARRMGSMTDDGSNRIINGIFEGQHMIGPDGKQYSVPANYASKSKLVEGDMLKLTIMNDGSFVYKQVGPIPRTRVIGALIYDSVNEQWQVHVNGNAYKVLLASVTYFKGEEGDEVVLLIPKEKSATWGAVENIIKKGQPRIEISADVEMPTPDEMYHPVIETSSAGEQASHQEADNLDDI